MLQRMQSDKNEHQRAKSQHCCVVAYSLITFLPKDCKLFVQSTGSGSSVEKYLFLQSFLVSFYCGNDTLDLETSTDIFRQICSCVINTLLKGFQDRKSDQR